MGKQLSVIESSQIEWVPVDSLQKIFMKKEPLSCPRVYELSGMEGETVSSRWLTAIANRIIPLR